MTLKASSSPMDGLRELVKLVAQDADGYVMRRLAGVLVLVVIASILTALGPMLLKFAVDGYRPSVMILLYVAAASLAARMGDFRGWVYARAERRMFCNFSTRVCMHVLNLPLRFHLDSNAGAVAKAVDYGLQGYQTILHHLVFSILPVATELATTIVVLGKFSSRAFLILFLAALVCYAVAHVRGAMVLGALAEDASAAQTDAAAAMTDAILNYELIKNSTGEAQIKAEMRQANGRTEREWVRYFSNLAYFGFRVGGVHTIFFAASGGYAAYQFYKGHMAIGELVLVVTYMLQVQKPVEMLGNAVQGISQGLAMLGKIFALFREAPEPRSGSRTVSRDTLGALEFVDVSVSFGPDKQVLRGVSFKVEPGTRVGIVGASGSGKSTTARVLLRHLEPDKGQILYDGVPISEFSLSSLRESIALVPQDTILLDGSIAYNIAFGHQSCTHLDIVEAAKLAHLHDWIMTLKDAYASRVGQRGVKLSGGERQRIAIARAAIKHARILVCDEATSSLDARTERDILRNLDDLSRSRTTLMIAHRLSTVMDMDQILVLEGGVIVERGSHHSLLSKDGVYARLWDAQRAHRVESTAA